MNQRRRVLMANENIKSDLSSKLLCTKCRKLVSYHICNKIEKTKIKGILIEYEDEYGVCDKCQSKIFVPGLEDKNMERLEKEFHQKMMN